MKKYFLFITVFSIVFAMLTFTNGQSVEDNYLEGLNSENHGLRVNSAYFLGEMKSERAVEPLMKLFKEKEDPGARLVAAWSLFKIGDERGIALIKEESENSDCDYLRCICEYFYKDFSLKKYGRIVL